jgi:hypothetical protein
MAPSTDKAIKRNFKCVVCLEKYAFAEFQYRMDVNNLPHRNDTVRAIAKREVQCRASSLRVELIARPRLARL